MSGALFRGFAWLALPLISLGCQAAFGIENKALVEADGGAPDAPSAPSHGCAENERSCEGATPRVCVAGTWVEKTACTGAQSVCHEGVCRENRSCISAAKGAGPSCGGNDGTVDCCASPLVKGGKFYRNYDGLGTELPHSIGGVPQQRLESHDDPRWPATLSDFRLDAFEVTVGRFRAFLAANAGTQENPPPKDAGAHPKIIGSGWNSAWNDRLLRDRRELEGALDCGKQVEDPSTFTKMPGAFESHPMLCVAWYEAFAFCAWDGARLPTDAQYNYAASGGSEHRLYPWGSGPLDVTRAVYDCRALDCVPPVGSFPLGRGKWGHHDLTGSAMEWVLDTYAEPHVPCRDCASIDDYASRSARGGGYSFLEALAGFSAAADGKLATQRIAMGFRCAREP